MLLAAGSGLLLAVPAGFWLLGQRVCRDPPEWGLSLCFGSSSEMLAVLTVLTVCGATPVLAWWLPRWRDLALVGPVAALVLGVDWFGQLLFVEVDGRCCYPSYSVGPFGILASPSLLMLYELAGIGACLGGLKIGYSRFGWRPLGWRFVGGSAALVANALGMTVLSPRDSWIGVGGVVDWLQQNGPSPIGYPTDLLIPVVAASLGLLVALPFWRPQKWLVGALASGVSAGIGLLVFFPFVPVAVVAGFVTLFAADRQRGRWVAGLVALDGTTVPVKPADL